MWYQSINRQFPVSSHFGVHTLTALLGWLVAHRSVKGKTPKKQPATKEADERVPSPGGFKNFHYYLLIWHSEIGNIRGLLTNKLHS